MFQKCFRDGYDFINVFVKMVSHEIKMSPQEIREWSLSDLIDIVSDILNKGDAETYAYYFPEA